MAQLNQTKLRAAEGPRAVELMSEGSEMDRAISEQIIRVQDLLNDIHQFGYKIDSILGPDMPVAATSCGLQQGSSTLVRTIQENTNTIMACAEALNTLKDRLTI